MRLRCADIEEPASQKEVRGRAKGHRGPALTHPMPILRVEMNAVRIHRALANETVVVVDVEIASTPRKKLGDPLHLAAILGDVRLQKDAGMIGEQSPAELELSLGGGRR